MAAELIALQNYDRVWIYDFMAEFHGFAIENFIEIIVPSHTGFEAFSAQVWEETKKSYSENSNFKTLVVLDEVSSYGRVGVNDHPCLGHFYRLGRHLGIDLISISQRFYSLPSIVRSQTDCFHAFQISEPRDVTYLKNLVAPIVLEQIIRLKKFEYLNIDLC